MKAHNRKCGLSKPGIRVMLIAYIPKVSGLKIICYINYPTEALRRFLQAIQANGIVSKIRI
jgi:hypothetical protein